MAGISSFAGAVQREGVKRRVLRK